MCAKTMLLKILTHACVSFILNLLAIICNSNTITCDNNNNVTGHLGGEVRGSGLFCGPQRIERSCYLCNLTVGGAGFCDYKSLSLQASSNRAGKSLLWLAMGAVHVPIARQKPGSQNSSLRGHSIHSADTSNLIIHLFLHKHPKSKDIHVQLW